MHNNNNQNKNEDKTKTERNDFTANGFGFVQIVVFVRLFPIHFPNR